MDAPNPPRLAPQWLSAVYPVCSHDLPNQLVALHSLLHLLDMDCSERLDDEGKEYLRRLHSVTDKVGELVDFLREMVRLTGFEPARERIPLASLVRELKARAAALPAVKATWETDGTSEPLVGDTRLILQAFMDLLPLLLEAAGGPDVRIAVASRQLVGAVLLEIRFLRPGASSLSQAARKRPPFVLATARLAANGAELKVLPDEPDVAGVAVLLPTGAS